MSAENKISVDAFASEKSLPEPSHPENSWEAKDLEDAIQMLRDCAKEKSGIRMVQIWLK